MRIELFLKHSRQPSAVQGLPQLGLEASLLSDLHDHYVEALELVEFELPRDIQFFAMIVEVSLVDAHSYFGRISQSPYYFEFIPGFGQDCRLFKRVWARQLLAQATSAIEMALIQVGGLFRNRWLSEKIAARAWGSVQGGPNVGVAMDAELVGWLDIASGCARRMTQPRRRPSPPASQRRKRPR